MLLKSQKGYKMAKNITPLIKDKHINFDMGEVVAVITAEQWAKLHDLAHINLALQGLMLDLLNNDDLYKG